MTQGFVLSIDQGTTGTTVLIFDHDGTIRGRAYSEFTQHYPQPGWVEHDASEIWAVSYQTRDVVEAMQSESGIELKELRCDGGAAVNRFLMQLQADMLGVPVEVPRVTETTALGAAYLAGLATGFWNSRADIDAKWQLADPMTPAWAMRQSRCFTHAGCWRWIGPRVGLRADSKIKTQFPA